VSLFDVSVKGASMPGMYAARKNKNGRGASLNHRLVATLNKSVEEHA
jgi:hypothetical protein